MTNDALVYTDENGSEQLVVDYLAQSAGDAPGSRYGTRTEDHTSFILAVARILLEQTGELAAHDLDFCTGLVVNDSDDVESLIREHGTDAERELLNGIE